MSRRDRNIRQPVTDQELRQATDTIERWYHEWVRSTAADLAHDFLTGEIADRNDFEERVDQVTDDAMTYNVDQSRTLFASNNVSEALDEAHDTGGETSTGVLAVLTFRIDVREAMPDFHEAEELDPFERSLWLAENHGTELLKLGEAGALYFIGEYENADYGVMVLNGEAEETKFESTRRFILEGEDEEAVQAVVAHLMRTGDDETKVEVDQWLLKRGGG